MTSIAGRVRMSLDEGPTELSIRIVAPEGTYETVNSDFLTPGPDARPYGETVGVLFAATVALPILSGGLYEVFIALNGEQVRRLAFDLSVVE